MPKRGTALYVSVVIVLALVTAVFLLWYGSRPDGEDELDARNAKMLPTRTLAPSTHRRRDLEERRIFVSIPSYRDPDCAQTVHDLFEKAKLPNRIFVGVCDQRLPSDESVQGQYEKLAAKRARFTQVSYHEFDARSAEGPMLARGVIERTLYANEEFVLMIDSHMRFVKSWDSLCFQQWDSLACPRAILTTYPPDYQITDRHMVAATRATFLRCSGFDPATSVPLLDGPPFAVAPTKQEKPVPSPFWAACFSFMPRAVIHKVQFPMDMPHLFFGEEFLMCLLYFVAGFKFYCPSRLIAFHKWTRNDRPTFFHIAQRDAAKAKARHNAYVRLRRILSSGTYLSKLIEKRARIRTFTEFISWTGVNTKTKQIEPHATRGITILADEREKLLKN